jgi:hypothetical protein
MVCGGLKMVSKQSVTDQIEELGFNQHGWGRAEIAELPHILLPGEKIYELANGTYEGGFALIVATDVRVLLVDKKPMSYLTVEDIRFDMISEIDYSHRLIGANIRISTGVKDMRFRSYNKARLRKLIGHVQNCMAESKRQLSQNQMGQNQHLERINEQLQTYLQAQADYQQVIEKLQSTSSDSLKPEALPSEPTPSHELSDYLFARSLIAQYEAQTGKKLDPTHVSENIPDPAAHLPTAEAAPSTDPIQATTNSDLEQILSAGVQEVFGKQKALEARQHHSFEINPVSVVFSKLPIVIRNRRFTRQLNQLMSDTMA